MSATTANSQTIPSQKLVLNKSIYQSVIDTNFHQLINTQVSTPTPTFTIDDFFQLYESLFYQIPVSGSNNSHQYILQTEAKYLGINLNQDNVQALLNEITSLQQEVLQLSQTINTLNNTTSPLSING